MNKSHKRTYGTTKQFAKKENVKPESIRSRLCLTGSYFGVVPNKRPNGRLEWLLESEES